MGWADILSMLCGAVLLVVLSTVFSHIASDQNARHCLKFGAFEHAGKVYECRLKEQTND